MIRFLLDLLGTPALLVGLFTMIGLILMKSPWHEVIKSTAKAILGFVVLQCGAEVLAGTLDVFGRLFEEAFGLRGIIPNNEATASLLLIKYGLPISIVMCLGMFVNILIARLSPLKYIFLTGHHILFMAALLVVVLTSAGLSLNSVILFGSILLGFCLSFFPCLVQWVMRKITGSDDFALGHFGSVGYLCSALIGLGVGRGSRSTEEIKFPRSLYFLRETSVSIILTMLPLFLIVSWIVQRQSGEEIFERLAGVEQSFIVFCLMKSVLFAAGIYIVLQGVRLILGEILPAFKGISDRLVPNAKPALDCPLVFPYAPNAVILGFLSSFAGGLIGLLFCGWFHWTLILPGVVPHFFCGATAGVFGNATGGIKGCLLGSFVHGIVITLLPLLLLSVFADSGFQNTMFGDTDFSLVGRFLAEILSILH